MSNPTKVPTDAGGNTELMRCSSEGDIENATQLLKDGVDINARNKQGATALLIGVLNNQPAMVALLLGYGADVTIASYKGLTPEVLATKNGNIELLNLLSAVKKTVSYNNNEIANEEGFIDGVFSKQEALRRIIRAAKIIFVNIIGWCVYAYATDLFSHPKYISQSIFITGIGIWLQLRYFRLRKK